MENDSFIEPLISRIFESYADDIAVNRNDRSNLPRESEILKALNGLLELIFPGYAEREAHSPATLRYAVGEIVTSLNMTLNSLFLRAFLFNCKNSGKKDCDCHAEAASAARELLEAIPSLRESMKLDIQAAYAGDPAARSLDEIVLSYPGVKAITIQRIAHKLYQLKVPMIPRMMTEYAHRITGIDIHPGAKLGKGVFIDHGTGVVIGETAELGNDVKIYQGVTLGALSFPKDACGMIIKGAKRHPTIEDGVTIYAGATILGAITIGKNSVIGGNVWLTEGTEPGTKITIASPELTINKSRKNPV
ncbi:MAG: serine acetyltransferase [Lentisphaeria bacterium]|jgi:serine O-acetyltransferase|nr:serine acetyltransferase [Lentisphaeria bacterium]MBO5803282.1 serine acetyltransferase [Lentisphaeria bacterium]